jgi:hypothetical protein
MTQDPSDKKTSTTECPTCGSKDPRLHPSAGDGGEVTKICPDEFHGEPISKEETRGRDRLQIQIFFKNGRDIIVDVEEFTSERNPFDGSLQSLRWTTDRGAYHAKLNWVDQKEVIAVVALRPDRR